MCLAQGHKTVMPVRLEPAAPRSRVKQLYHWATVLPNFKFLTYDRLIWILDHLKIIFGNQMEESIRIMKGQT